MHASCAAIRASMVAAVSIGGARLPAWAQSKERRCKGAEGARGKVWNPVPDPGREKRTWSGGSV